ncbi:hypothetical protein ACHQM5_012321 [Ranunculus cassubicifolius]
MVLAVFIVLGILISYQQTFAQTECEAEERALMQECEEVFYTRGPPPDPSPECCDRIGKLDFACVCMNNSRKKTRRHVSKQDKYMMDRLLYAADFCGNPQASICRVTGKHDFRV